MHPPTPPQPTWYQPRNQQTYPPSLLRLDYTALLSPELHHSQLHGYFTGVVRGLDLGLIPRDWEFFWLLYPCSVLCSTHLRRGNGSNTFVCRPWRLRVLLLAMPRDLIQLPRLRWFSYRRWNSFREGTGCEIFSVSEERAWLANDSIEVHLFLLSVGLRIRYRPAAACASAERFQNAFGLC